MEKLLIFILATAGLVWLTNYSKLFKPLREAISRKFKKYPNLIFWFLSSIFGCQGCMSVWAGAVCYFLPQVVLYIFLGCITTVFIITILNKI